MLALRNLRTSTSRTRAKLSASTCARARVQRSQTGSASAAAWNGLYGGRMAEIDFASRSRQAARLARSPGSLRVTQALQLWRVSCAGPPSSHSKRV